MTLNNQLPAGIILINKPVGVSTFQVTKKVARLLPKKTKVGHIGTLDPFADGLVVIAFAGAQRLSDMVHDLYSKQYIAIGEFGKKSDTGDCDGEFVDIDENIPNISYENLCETINSFVGVYWQKPHSVSASKFKGKKLYEWARQGVFIEKDPKRREIFSVSNISINLISAKFSVDVSSGTYVRSLFEDIAEKLNTFGHLTSLTRSKIGPFDLKDAIEFSDLTFENLKLKMKDVTYLVDYPIVDLSEDEFKRVINGNFIKTENIYSSKVFLKFQNTVLAVAEYKEGQLLPRIVF